MKYRLNFETDTNSIDHDDDVEHFKKILHTNDVYNFLSDFKKELRDTVKYGCKEETKNQILSVEEQSPEEIIKSSFSYIKDMFFILLNEYNIKID